MVQGPEGEAGGEDEVRDGQVEDEDVGEGLEVLVQSQDHKDKNVSCEAQCDHHREENRDDVVSKCDHIVLFTEKVIVIVTVILAPIEGLVHYWSTETHKKKYSIIGIILIDTGLISVLQ